MPEVDELAQWAIINGPINNSTGDIEQYSGIISILGLIIALVSAFWTIRPLAIDNL
jgi:hypothetical protein